VRVIAEMLGLPQEDGDKFRGFIYRILEAPGIDHNMEYEDTLDFYLRQKVEERQLNPKDGDLIDFLMNAEMGGEKLTGDHIGLHATPRGGPADGDLARGQLGHATHRSGTQVALTEVGRRDQARGHRDLGRQLVAVRRGHEVGRGEACREQDRGC